jgi:FkbM family methyltransferase
VSSAKRLIRRLVGDRAYIWLHRHRTSKWQIWFWVLAGRQVRGRPDISRVTERHGDWTVCPAGLGPDSVVYSVGIGRDISFDLSLIQRYGMTIHAFDPTPESLAWVRSQSLPPELRVHELGLAGFDGTAEFAAAAEPSNIYYSMVQQPGARTIQGEVRTLDTLMAMLGHRHIDLLKIDIEGAEYDVIDQVVNAGTPVSQLLVEFHHRDGGASRTRAALRLLRQSGYRVFNVAPSYAEYSLLHL